MSKDSLNTEIGNNSLTPSTEVGQGCQIAAVADSVLCGLVGKIVARQEENCKRLWGEIEMGTGPLVGLDKLMFCAEFAVFMLSVLKTRRPMRVEAPLLF